MPRARPEHAACEIPREIFRALFGLYDIVVDVLSTLSMSARHWPLGARGAFPVHFPTTLTQAQFQEVVSVPGVQGCAGGVRTTWDVAPVIAEALRQPCPPVPTEDNVDLVAEVKQLPGLAQYLETGLRDVLRDYQKVGAIFLARRAYAINADPMRSGKTLQALAGSVLTGAQRTLIVCPALAKPVWATQIGKWLGEEAVLLEGRAGTKARIFCATCQGRGYTPTARHCPACKLRNGQSHGFRIVTLDDPERSLHAAIARARYVIVNFELLVAQQDTYGEDSPTPGKKYYRDDLPGWCPALAQHTFELAIADESHLLRGWSTDRTKLGYTRREKFNQATALIPQVWLLTGTPVFGYTRDLWGQLDAMSAGAVTGPSRLPFDFHTRFCEGHRDEYGWRANGESPFAHSELPRRLAVIKIQRPRSLILADMPAKQREVYRIDQDPSVVRSQAAAARKGFGKSKQGRIAKLLTQTGVAKRDTVVENVMNELSAGDKVIVFALLKANATGLAKQFEQKIKRSRDWSARMRQVNCEMWVAHGDVSSQMRFAFARSFTEHNGAAVFVTTIDAMQVAVSLKGATQVHFADLHWSPAAMLQAEDRPYEPGTSGLTINYYVMKGSIDEHIEAVVLSKFKTQEKVVAEEGAVDVRATFAGAAESLDEVIARLTNHLGPDDDDDEFADLDAA